MQKVAKRIEIVSSSKVGLSSMSYVSRTAIRKVLARHYMDVSITLVNDFADLQALVERRPDLVFLGMKFIPLDPRLGQNDPQKIWLSEYLDEHEIAYTGSNHLAHELELNKNLAKQRVLDAGLQTSAFQFIKQDHDVTEADITLSFPLFIKPANRGGGLGIDSASVVHDATGFIAKVRAVSALKSDSLVETYLSGREFSVAILKDADHGGYSAMPLELVAPENEHGNRLLSAEIKSADTESFSAVDDHSIKSAITTMALHIFHALGARDYGRIDIRMDDKGIPYFLEANLIPSLIDKYGNFPKACMLNKLLSYENMLLNIVSLGLMRTISGELDEPESEPLFSPLEPLLNPA